VLWQRREEDTTNHDTTNRFPQRSVQELALLLTFVYFTRSPSSLLVAKAEKWAARRTAAAEPIKSSSGRDLARVLRLLRLSPRQPSSWLAATSRKRRETRRRIPEPRGRQ
jgi:hypothetical protein